MDPLAKLFGSAARLKLLRLFLFNDDTAFTSAEAAFRAKLSKDATRKEISVLSAAGVIRKKTGTTSYIASRKFPYYDALQQFLRTTTNLSDADFVNTLKKAGSLRLVVLSGLFTGAIETKVDLLVVGDKLDDKPLEAAVRTLEAELGRELCFASFSTEEFRYRQGVYDRLIRDVMDYPKRIILDRIGIK